MRFLRRSYPTTNRYELKQEETARKLINRSKHSYDTFHPFGVRFYTFSLPFSPSRTPPRVQWEGDLPSDSYFHGSLYAFHFSLRLPLTAVGKRDAASLILYLFVPFSGKTAAVPEGGRTMRVLSSNITNRNTTLGGRTRAPSQRR